MQMLDFLSLEAPRGSDLATEFYELQEKICLISNEIRQIFLPTFRDNDIVSRIGQFLFGLLFLCAERCDNRRCARMKTTALRVMTIPTVFPGS